MPEVFQHERSSQNRIRHKKPKVPMMKHDGVWSLVDARTNAAPEIFVNNSPISGKNHCKLIEMLFGRNEI